MTFVSSLPPASVAVENSEESLSEFSVHETVGDWVATGTDVRQ
jgi:hypothetical protein